MSGVPDETYFGPDERGIGISYGEVRISSPERKVQLLENRLRDLLLKQINKFASAAKGESYAPIPLVIMTCVAIETIGIILYRYDNKSIEKEQRYCFKKVIDKFDQKFSRAVSKDFRALLQTRFSTEEIYKAESRSEIIYAYFRNTFIHGYFGRAVYVDETVLKWEDGDGYLVLNPSWFWQRFIEVFDELFREVHSNKEPTNSQVKSIHTYLDHLLS